MLSFSHHRVTRHDVITEPRNFVLRNASSECACSQMRDKDKDDGSGEIFTVVTLKIIVTSL
jgi:hypothetical protein